MKVIHVPKIDGRYWAAITLASVFGTNLGDLYAHETGLGILPGLAVLATLAGAMFVAERFDRRVHPAYYWAAIIIIRTGATNIADYLAFRAHISPVLLSLVLAAIIAICALISVRAGRQPDVTETALPRTGADYWTAMLAAGVFGTVVGDVSQHVFGQLPASIGLSLLTVLAVLLRQRSQLQPVVLYWVAVATARTAGTALGDLLAENPALDIGLMVATAITGALFLAVLLIAPRTARTARSPAGSDRLFRS